MLLDGDERRAARLRVPLRRSFAQVAPRRSIDARGSRSSAAAGALAADGAPGCLAQREALEQARELELDEEPAELVDVRAAVAEVLLVERDGHVGASA